MSYSPLLNVKISRPSKHAKTGKSENQREKRKTTTKKRVTMPAKQRNVQCTDIVLPNCCPLQGKLRGGEKKKVSVCVVLHQIPVM